MLFAPWHPQPIHSPQAPFSSMTRRIGREIAKISMRLLADLEQARWQGAAFTPDSTRKRKGLDPKTAGRRGGKDFGTDEDETLVGLGVTLHAAEQLVHQIQRRHVLQVGRHRRCRCRRRRNSRALEVVEVALCVWLVGSGRVGSGFWWALRFPFGWGGDSRFFLRFALLGSLFGRGNKNKRHFCAWCKYIFMN